MQTNKTNVYVGSLKNKGEQQFILYYVKDGREVNFFNEKELYSNVTKGPSINHLLQYYQNRFHESIELFLTQLSQIVNTVLDTILKDYGHMKISYYDSKDAFFEAIDTRQFIQEIEVKKNKKYIKKM